MNSFDKIEKRKINVNSKILDALKQMDLIDKKLLLVFNKDKFVNILSIGDVQRAILNGIDLNTKIENILRKNTRVASVDDNFNDNYKIDGAIPYGIDARRR